MPIPPALKAKGLPCGGPGRHHKMQPGTHPFIGVAYLAKWFYSELF